MLNPTPSLKSVALPKGALEYKAISSATAELKDIDFKNKVVSCYLSAFGNKDFDSDIMMPGCYKKTIAENGPQGKNTIFYLKSHNWENPLGKPTVLREDVKGLYAEVPVTSGASFAEDTLKLMAAGLMVQNSVGFSCVKANIVQPDAQDYDTWYREITEVRLYEGSAVVLGANDQTPFEGFKSLSLKDLGDMEKRVIKTLRSGDLRDETYERLEIALKQLTREYFLLGQSESSKSLAENTQPSEMATCPDCGAETAVPSSGDIECSACKCMFTKTYTVVKPKPIAFFGAIANIKLNY